MKALYCGIDLHSSNHHICVIDGQDKRLLEIKCANVLEATLNALKKFKHQLKGVAIESTFNWYWLVDGLMEAGYHVDLVNTAKVVQYEGLKHTGDRYDAFHLAHLMRLGILPTGYIYPKERRGLRDLLRKRMQLVQDRSSHIIRFKSMLHNHFGYSERADKIKAQKYQAPDVADSNVKLALGSHLSMVRAYSRQIRAVEKVIAQQLQESPELECLKSVPGIGDILAQTLWLEVGDINRFKGPGQFASYCRCVSSRRESNGKKKGENNRKNGNKYLAWALIEAANFAIRRSDKAKRFYQKKSAATHMLVARKALAHKLARACYWILKRQQPYNEGKLFH
jgi:transposase